MIAKTLGPALAAALLPAAPPPPTGLHECATATTRCDGSIEIPLDKVSGRIALTPDGHATATLTAETVGRTHEVTLSWTAFSTRQSVSGTFALAPFV